MTYTTTYQSPLGQLTLASDGEKLTGLWIENQKYFAASVREEMIEDDSPAVFSQVKEWLDRYFDGERPDVRELEGKLAPAGSSFRQEVWQILCRIPYGETLTYGKIAARVAETQGRPSMSAQAVGGAVGHNPISIIIPCHRVVGADGSLTGYAGGMEKKQWLLHHEGMK